MAADRSSVDSVPADRAHRVEASPRYRGPKSVMRNFSRVVALALSTVLLITVAQGAENSANPDLSRFVGKYCLKCHDADTRKADHDFTALRLPLASEADLITAKDIIDQLTLREMPPAKEAQPADEERLAAIRELRGGIAAARGRIAGTGARVGRHLRPVSDAS